MTSISKWSTNMSKIDKTGNNRFTNATSKEEEIN